MGAPQTGPACMNETTGDLREMQDSLLLSCYPNFLPATNQPSSPMSPQYHLLSTWWYFILPPVVHGNDYVG